MRRALVLFAALCAAGCPQRDGGGEGAPAATGPAATTTAAADLARGKAIYDVHCAACHGVNGDGQGPAAFLLEPRPRDFTMANYRLVSSADGMPTDEDLLATITRGMPGSSMPSWAHLPESDRRALVAVVKSFAPERFAGEREPIAVPPEPPADAASIARGANVYAASCQACHGPTGKGDGPQKMVDDREHPIRPRDFTQGTFKGSPAARDLFLRVRAGLPGSPMPSSGSLSDRDVWDVVHFVQSLTPPGAAMRGVQVRRTIRAPRVASAPTHPTDAAWEEIPATEVVLAPLAWRDERVESLAVQAAHDGKTIAFRLGWACAAPSDRTLRTEDFRDACAVQIATNEQEPFFGMGHAGAPVELLQWKADWQRDIAAAAAGGVRGGIDDQYPFAATDQTPAMLDFAAARDAGNLLAAAARKSPVELAEAQGQGTLASAPAAAQSIAGAGAWEGGRWRVTIVRPLGKPDDGCADLAPGGRRPVAFAVWQGALRDRNGLKNVSMWHDLEIEEGEARK